MSPLGKLTLALIGLRFWGADGFFCGLFLGHMFIDKTYAIRKLEQQMSRFDDYIRVRLPYKYYRYYNRIDGNILGKIWGAILGALLFGFWGFVILFIVGQVVFDMPANPDIRRAKKNVDHFFDNNWGKILGAIIGFVLESSLLIFVGLILGFIYDYQRLEGAKLIPFDVLSNYWQKINPLKLWRHAESGEHRKYLEIMAAISALIAEVDGKISEKEKEVFKKLFAVKDKKGLRVLEIFENKLKHRANIEKYASVLEELTRDNENLKEVSLENLFKIAGADGVIKHDEMAVLEQVAQVINLDEKTFTKLKKQFTPKPINKKLKAHYDVLGVSYDADLDEIKSKWKKLIVIYHPDKLLDASEEERKIATEKMAAINLAYQEIVKVKGKK